MAPSPTIPTSFVPKQPVRPSQRFYKSGGNLFLLIACIALGVSLAGVAGVFAYERYLENVRESKSAAVQQAQADVDSATVEDFIRTRDRFTAAKGLLGSHVAVSQFFDLLESVTLQSVRFNSLSFILAEDRSAEIQMKGVARTFNALAAESSAFASEKRIKRAIFSDINVNANGTVSFALDADLSPNLLLMSLESVSDAPVLIPVTPSFTGTTTATTTPVTAPATTTPKTGSTSPLSL